MMIVYKLIDVEFDYRFWDNDMGYYYATGYVVYNMFMEEKKIITRNQYKSLQNLGLIE